ncbi:MAG: Gfo/Idh/MocA family oxidoreductase [Acuticoccus sp.]
MVIVGTGFVAPYHVAGWRGCPGVEVVAAVERDPDAAGARLGELGIARAYGTIAEAVAGEAPDIIDIASPLCLHAAHVRTAAAAGCHLMVQKPLAPTLEEAIGLYETVRAAGVRAMVHENFRFRPWNRALKSVLARGDIGTPFYLRSAQRMAGTVLSTERPQTPWNIARQPFFAGMERLIILEAIIHQIDVARYLLGEPTRVYARARRVSPHVRGEDTAMLVLSFEGVDALIERSYASLGHPSPASGQGESVVVEGDLGTAFISPEGAVRVVRDGPAGRSEETVPVDIVDAYPRSYAGAIAHFVEGLRRGTPFETDLADNLGTLAATLAAYRSVATGEAVPLVADPARMDASL